MFFPLAANYIHPQWRLWEVGFSFQLGRELSVRLPVCPAQPSPAQPSNTVSSLLSAGCCSDAFTIHGCCRHAVVRRLRPPAACPHRWEWNWTTLKVSFATLNFPKTINYSVRIFHFGSAVYSIGDLVAKKTITHDYSVNVFCPFTPLNLSLKPCVEMMIF